MTSVTRHTLLSKAVTVQGGRPHSETAAIEFDESCGFWRVTQTARPMILSEIYATVRRGSKKRDLETGEDQKGE